MYLHAAQPVVLLKSNRTPESSEIAKFHTSALAGDDRVVDEAMKQVGAHRVENLYE
jgi:acetyltransferase